ncbi:hypothetical protein AG1IA_00417 [Rhizoctonia solani AG-1 IA]|uniref:Uncharacterized protein n=1 Tax=Thanatephorus cucumeris (strain AG1-IA) TaxID=983506 RepID=L8XA32_THACA|nr:hypothetical protein AG1IA_00417 [Rhizoctonia solani AG-1 IA]
MQVPAVKSEVDAVLWPAPTPHAHKYMKADMPSSNFECLPVAKHGQIKYFTSRQDTTNKTICYNYLQSIKYINAYCTANANFIRETLLRQGITTRDDPPPMISPLFLTRGLRARTFTTVSSSPKRHNRKESGNYFSWSARPNHSSMDRTHGKRSIKPHFVSLESNSYAEEVEEEPYITVMVPRETFTRDANAQLVASALNSRDISIPAYVNERHDIVVHGKKMSFVYALNSVLRVLPQ